MNLLGWFLVWCGASIFTPHLSVDWWRTIMTWQFWVALVMFLVAKRLWEKEGK